MGMDTGPQGPGTPDDNTILLEQSMLAPEQRAFLEAADTYLQKSPITRDDIYTLAEGWTRLKVISDNMLERFNQVIRAYFNGLLRTYGYEVTIISPFEHGGDIKQAYLVLSADHATFQAHGLQEIVEREVALFQDYRIQWQVRFGEVRENEMEGNEQVTSLIVGVLR